MYKLGEENSEWVKLVNIISLVRKYRDEDVFYDVMHLKTLGHKIVAQLILKALQKSDFLN